MREIHAVKKTREFHDNENEKISGESIRGPALIRERRLLTFLSQVRRFFGISCLKRAIRYEFFTPEIFEYIAVIVQ